MGILSGNPKDEPLHYGEVFNLWTTLGTNYGKIAGYQTFYNHAGDDDLKKLIEDAVQLLKDEAKILEKILKLNGVGLPPAPPERPIARAEDIPPGAKFNDPEISAVFSADIAVGLDIAMIYGQFHMNKTQLGSIKIRVGWFHHHYI